MAEPQFVTSMLEVLGQLGYVKVNPQGNRPTKTNTMGTISFTDVAISLELGGSLDRLVKDLSGVAQGNPVTNTPQLVAYERIYSKEGDNRKYTARVNLNVVKIP